MGFLEARVPPPLVGVVAAALMAWLAGGLPAGPTDGLRLAIALALAGAGVAFDVAGLLAFRRARTTVNPMRPEKASALVAQGVYRVSRNPMYVGFVLMLAGWAAWLASSWAWLGPAAYAAYITRFQIVPEERAMAARFGADFERYRQQVRRWL